MVRYALVLPLHCRFGVVLCTDIGRREEGKALFGSAAQQAPRMIEIQCGTVALPTGVEPTTR
ncbi:MAG TPA: hypothetical protein VHN13_01380 [Candidatus Tectomicrobia bacterium]|nr:hypothetical protein [Candidatus Tectomicrobia bacterium]